MDTSLIAQFIINGLMLGMMYALVAVGFTLFFGVLNVIVFSHGDTVMLGAFTGLATYAYLSATYPTMSAALALAIVLAVAIGAMALFGVILGRTLIMRLRRAPALNTLLATMMLGTVMRESIRLFYPNGSNPQPFPHLLPDTSLALGALSLRLDNVILFLAGAAYLICLLKAEAQMSIAAAIAGGVAAVALLKIAGVLDPVLECVHRAGRLWAGLMLAMAVFLVLFFHDDHYVLFLLGTVFIYSTAVLGINVQLGYTGLINFAGASFFGVGGYTAALLMTDTGLTPVLAILAGGISASLVGCILLLPVLRTSGNYAALVTMAFALLFKVFLEVCPWFGGPQGVPVDPFSLFGFSFAEEPKLFGMECSFYLSYDFLAIVLLVAVFAFTTLLERSWLGLSLDAVREDETASACFGISIARWKIWAFTVGNFICGIAGAYYAMMLAYISPANFAFSGSLLFLSILLLGGLGSRWGVILAAAFMVMLPEKFQVIQEYRYLIYSAIVLLMILYRPAGLLPRGPRTYTGRA